MESVQQLLKQACENHGEVEFRDNYSGRGMYGRRCIGITGSRDDCASVITEVACLLMQEVFDAAIDADSDSERNAAYDANDAAQNMLRTLIDEQSSDNMGRDIIIYWPKLEWQEEPIEGEDNGDEVLDFDSNHPIAAVLTVDNIGEVEILTNTDARIVLEVTVNDQQFTGKIDNPTLDARVFVREYTQMDADDKRLCAADMVEFLTE